MLASCGTSPVKGLYSNPVYEQTMKERAERTPEEDKLDGILLALVRVADGRDTSAQKIQAASDLLRDDKDLDADSLGRINVNIFLKGVSYQEEVAARVDSLDGVVRYASFTLPDMGCKISPKNVLTLASLPGILRMECPHHGFTRTEAPEH
jgi:hypothetical protein